MVNKNTNFKINLRNFLVTHEISVIIIILDIHNFLNILYIRVFSIIYLYHLKSKFFIYI